MTSTFFTRPRTGPRQLLDLLEESSAARRPGLITPTAKGPTAAAAVDRGSRAGGPSDAASPRPQGAEQVVAAATLSRLSPGQAAPESPSAPLAAAAPRQAPASVPAAAADSGRAGVLGRPEGFDPGAASSIAPLAPRLVVHWLASSVAVERQAAHAAVGATPLPRVDKFLAPDPEQGVVEIVELPAGLSLQQALRAYAGLPGVALVEQDFSVGLQAVANDPYYASNGALWGMASSDSPTIAGPSGTTNSFGSQAEQAWLQDYTGSSKTVFAVLDEGIDYTHPDLYLNMWLNQGEIRTLSFFNQLTDVNLDGLITFRDLNSSLNAAYVTDLNANSRIDAGDLLSDVRWEDGIDSDANGYLDDLVGWNYYTNTNDPFNPAEGDNHGTHVAGTIGAIGGNGIGVAGVNWDIQILPMKFLGPNGGYTSSAASAVNYFADLTKRYDRDYGGVANYVGINNSWGGGGYLSSLHKAIVEAGRVGNIFVAAAGNSSANNDSTSNYPSNYSTLSAPSGTQPLSWEAVVAVASITSSGSLSSFSNYGAATVDLGAPGSSINSTVSNGGYANYSGTSMASPHVSGSLALLASTYPTATAPQLLQALYGGVSPTSSLNGKTSTGGRLNLSGSLSQLESILAGGGGGGGGGGTPPPTDPSRLIWGTTASDTLTGTAGGGSGADQITGVTASGTTAANLGRGQIDRVSGGLGADVFLLADSRGRFYDDGSNRSSGSGDYLWVVDFNAAEDQIKIRANSQLIIRNLTINGTPYTEIFMGNGDNSFSAADELTARLQGLSLAPGSGAWVISSASWVTT